MCRALLSLSVVHVATTRNLCVYYLHVHVGVLQLHVVLHVRSSKNPSCTWLLLGSCCLGDHIHSQGVLCGLVADLLLTLQLQVLQMTLWTLYADDIARSTCLGLLQSILEPWFLTTIPIYICAAPPSYNPFFLTLTPVIPPHNRLTRPHVARALLLQVHASTHTSFLL